MATGMNQADKMSAAMEILKQKIPQQFHQGKQIIWSIYPLNMRLSLQKKTYHLKLWQRMWRQVGFRSQKKALSLLWLMTLYLKTLKQNLFMSLRYVNVLHSSYLTNSWMSSSALC